MTEMPLLRQPLFVMRELNVVDTSDKVLIEVGAPEYVTETEAVCPYRFVYQEKVWRHDTHGVDAFQALQLALKVLPLELRHNKFLPIGKMYLFEVGDDMGFPEGDGFQFPEVKSQ